MPGFYGGHIEWTPVNSPPSPQNPLKKRVEELQEKIEELQKSVDFWKAGDSMFYSMWSKEIEVSRKLRVKLEEAKRVKNKIVKVETGRIQKGRKAKTSALRNIKRCF